MGVLHKDAKDVYSIVVIFFGLKVDINLFMVPIFADKLTYIFQAIYKILSQSFLILKEISSFTGFYLFALKQFI